MPPDRPESFADALGRLLADPRRLAEFGRASRERASQFTIDGMVDRTIAAYLILSPRQSSETRTVVVPAGSSVPGSDPTASVPRHNNRPRSRSEHHGIETPIVRDAPRAGLPREAGFPPGRTRS